MKIFRTDSGYFIYRTVTLERLDPFAAAGDQGLAREDLRHETRCISGPGRRRRPAGRIAANVATLVSQQSSHGSFVASPDFGEYGYCWPRR